MMKRDEQIAESDCREGLVHNMMTSIRKTISPARNDTPTRSGAVALSARPGFILLALLAAMAVGMLILAPNVFAQNAEMTFSYSENGTDPITTFTASDPEGVTPIVWSLPVSEAGITIGGVPATSDDIADHLLFGISSAASSRSMIRPTSRVRTSLAAPLTSTRWSCRPLTAGQRQRRRTVGSR